MKKMLVEFIGTFFLVLAVCTTQNPIAIGLMLMAMVYMGGHISGGHYNPAVSLAVWVRGKLSFMHLLLYWISQLLGGICASLVFQFVVGKYFFPSPSMDASIYQAMTVEALFTFVLCSVVLAVATCDSLNGNFIYGLAIGLSLVSIAFAGGISGGAYNPAVGLGPIIGDLITGGTFADLCAIPATHCMMIYSAGPLLGGLVAGVVYKIVNTD